MVLVDCSLNASKDVESEGGGYTAQSVMLLNQTAFRLVLIYTACDGAETVQVTLFRKL